ncbi:calmodulin [Moniliophthora roreri]|nr:calmodulin [Moniliophthora roreri]
MWICRRKAQQICDYWDNSLNSTLPKGHRIRCLAEVYGQILGVRRRAGLSTVDTQREDRVYDVGGPVGARMIVQYPIMQMRTRYNSCQHATQGGIHEKKTCPDEFYKLVYSLAALIDIESELTLITNGPISINVCFLDHGINFLVAEPFA